MAEELPALLFKKNFTEDGGPASDQNKVSKSLKKKKKTQAHQIELAERKPFEGSCADGMRPGSSIQH